MTERLTTEPLYEKLAKRLRELVGKYDPGQRFLSEREIAAEFQLSPVTVRSAIAALCQEGVLRRQHGSGTYVCEVLSGDPSAAGLVVMVVCGTGHFNSPLYHAMIARFQDDQRGVLLAYLAKNVAVSPDATRLLDRHLARKPAAFVVQGDLGHNLYQFGERRHDIRNLIIFDNDEFPPLLEAHRVLFDFAGAIHAATEHLLATGGRRFAVLSMRQLGSTRQQMLFRQGIVQALHEHDCDEDRQIWFTPRGKYATEKEIEAWIESVLSGPRPDGVICVFDYLAYLVVRVARRHGIRVPEDLMVTGLFDTPWSSACAVPITTVRFDIGAMAAAVAQRIDATSGFETTLIPFQLVVRESTGGCSTSESVDAELEMV